LLYADRLLSSQGELDGTFDWTRGRPRDGRLYIAGWLLAEGCFPIAECPRITYNRTRGMSATEPEPIEGVPTAHPKPDPTPLPRFRSWQEELGKMAIDLETLPPEFQRFENAGMVRLLFVIATQLEELLAILNTIRIPTWLSKTSK
jgi:hypothetical protein